MIISLQFFGGNGQSLTSGLGTNPRNPLPLLDSDSQFALDLLLRDKESIVYEAPVQEVSLNNIKTMQTDLNTESLNYFLAGGKADELPVVVNTPKGNVVIDGNNRIVTAVINDKTSIKAHYVKLSDLNLSADELRELYRRKG